MRTYLLALRWYYALRERQHIRAAARCEEGRRRTLKRLALCDAPKPYRAPRYRRLLKVFWEC